MKPLASAIRRLNSVAVGDAHASLIIQNASLLNVYTGEIQRDMQVAVSQDRIAYVGSDASHTRGAETRIADAHGKLLVPGMADAHMHIDQFVMPQEFAEYALLHGVTTLFSDPIDIVSTCGHRGFAEFLRQCKQARARIFNVVPGGLPVNRKFSTARTLTPQQEAAALKRDDVIGLGEVFSWTRVTKRDASTMQQLERTLESSCVINGHTAGASGKKLQAYVASGIFSCHEPVDYTQALERLRLGMWVMIREGSIRRDLRAIVSDILARKTDTSRLMFCSDGISPPDMLRYGHIDHCVREAVRTGMDVATAYTISSRNVFDYYGMQNDLGGIAPGRIADIVVMDDAKTARVRDVYVAGTKVVSNRKMVGRQVQYRAPSWASKTVRIRNITEDDFKIHIKADGALVNTIVMKSEIITALGSARLEAHDGALQVEPDSGVLIAAAFDRSGRSRARTVSFIEGMGNINGAIASTWSFHENDMIVIGSNERDMAVAARDVMSHGGGICVARNKRCAARIPLSFSGIVSDMSLKRCALALEGVNSAMRKAGSRFERSHLVPLFLPFLALPSVRLVHGGLVDIKSDKMLPTTLVG